MNERRERLQRELEHLTKTFKAGIMTEKEFNKGKDRIENKLKELDSEEKKEDQSKEIINEILEEKSEDYIAEEETEEEKPKRAAPKPAKKKAKRKEDEDEEGDFSGTILAIIIIIGIIAVLGYSFRGYIADKFTGAATVEKSDLNTTKVIDIDVFGDYSCKHCAKLQDTLKLVKLYYGDNVNINYFNYPVDADSVGPMLALGCAEKQGAFWRYNVLLSDESKGKIADERLVELAKSLELDTEAFSTCLENQDTKGDLMSDILRANEEAISSVPSIVIEGDVYKGYRDFDEMKEILTPRFSEE